MRIVSDTNILLAVALNEPERDWLVRVSKGHDLVAPAVLPFEVGNALSTLVKRNKLAADQAAAILDVISDIPIELAEIDIRKSLLLSSRCGIYAYDAYFLQCALELRCPLLSLDRGMKHTAKTLDIKLIERVQK